MFYTIDQNNSGGYFIENDDVTQYVIVEANSVDDAINLLKDITEPYGDYCPCCGERWNIWLDEDDGNEVPMIYDKPVSEVKKESYIEECIIYYLDGRREKIIFK